MSKLKKYLLDTLGLEIKLRNIQLKDVRNLPLYLREIYFCMSTEIFGHDIILLQQKNREHFTIGQYRKHVDIFEKIMSRPVVLVIDDLKAYSRKRLIEKKVAFIVPEKQMFIPQLLIDLKEFRYSTQKRPDKFQPSTQCLLFSLLLRDNIEGMDFKTIAKKLGYSATTISRSVKEMVDLQLCSIEGTKSKRIVFFKHKKALWEQAFSYFVNPVRTIVHTENAVDTGLTCKTSYMALSFYTELAEKGDSCFAVSQRDYNILKKKGDLKITHSSEGPFCLEVWKYPPCVLSAGQYVDPLSLYMTFRDTEDERVRKAIESMVNNLW